MRKKIKKYGTSYVIVVTPEELESYDIVEGDFIDIDVIKVIKRKNSI